MKEYTPVISPVAVSVQTRPAVR